MPEAWKRMSVFPTQFSTARKICFPPDQAERNDDAYLLKPLQFVQEIRPAVLEFGWQRFVVWGAAVDGRCNVTIDESQSIVPMRGSRLIGEPESVQCAIEPISGAIPCKDTASPISAMRCGCKSDQQELRVGRTKAGHGSPPIFPIPKSPDFVVCDFLAINDKPGASTTVDNFSLGRPLHALSA